MGLLKKNNQNLVSLDFSQKGLIKIACAKSRGGNFRLLNYDFKKISSLDNKDEVIDFIKGFLKRNSIKNLRTYLTIPDSDSLIIRSLNLPVLPKREIPQAAKWQLKEDAPFNLDSAVCDWQIVAEYTDKDAVKKNKIMFIAAERKAIDKYLSIADECNLDPVLVTASSFNYANILKYLNKDIHLQAVIDIGDSDTSLSIYEKNKLTFIRKLTFSLDRLTYALTEVLASDRGDIKLSLKEAENIRDTFGIPQELNGILNNNIRSSQIISLMRPLLEGLVREIKASFDYFVSSLNTASPSILYITGRGANLKNLSVYLNKELNINVEKLPLPNCFNTETIEKEKLDNDYNVIVSCLGAILAPDRGINLFPQEIRIQKIELIQKASLRLTTFTLGLIFLLILGMVKFQINDYKNRLRNAQLHLGVLEKASPLKEIVFQRERLINIIQKDKVPVDGLLRLISILVTDKIMLDELMLDQIEHTLVIRGKVLASEDVADSILTSFMKGIESSLFFSEARLVFSNRLEGVQTFEIKCNLAL